MMLNICFGAAFFADSAAEGTDTFCPTFAVGIPSPVRFSAGSATLVPSLLFGGLTVSSFASVFDTNLPFILNLWSATRLRQV